MAKDTVVCLYSGILFSFKKEDPDFWDNVDESGGHHAKKQARHRKKNTTRPH